MWPGSVFIGMQLRRYTVVRTASPQKEGGEFRVGKGGLSSVGDGPDVPLDLAILLVCVWCSGLYGYAHVVQFYPHLSFNELLCIVDPDRPDLVSRNVFPGSFHFHPGCTCAALEDQERTCTIVRVVIEYGQEVPLFFPYQNWVGAAGVDMDEFAYFLSLMFVR